ncbi:cytochrome c oxidase subunit 7A2, mitochondrial-like [Heptranchias perlo]|uniref:cytochrome c oxidase subunit 7A2, mitochondrial-like n=1 Tax=Heptranchias perlo TaxID=212740 RepID=UPI00355A01CB
MSGLGIRGLRAFQQLSQRTFSTATRRQVQNRIAEKQKLFQEDNGMPVYLKGGVADAVLYRLTMALTVVGTGYVMYELFVAALPKKQ